MSRQNTTQQRDAFVDGLIESTAGAFEVFTVYIGDRLGLYEALADGGPLTAAALATRTGTHERYVREWLEQQTVAGILAVDDETAETARRRYRVPPAHVEVLTDRDSLAYVPPLAQIIAGAVHPLQDVVEAYRTGDGVPFEDYGQDLREGQARMNRASFLGPLGEAWLPAIADVHDRLRRIDPPARVADIGCGAAHSCIGIACHYPTIRVDGFDLDAASVELARENVTDAGLTERITIHRRDASDPDIEGDYDLVCAFECVHDMSDPVGALRTMRRLAGADGTVLVMDERVGESFAEEGELDWMMYGWSVLHCLPVGLAERPSAATGTVMRAGTLRAYTEDAGFESVEVLPIENDFFRFYRLDP